MGAPFLAGCRIHFSPAAQNDIDDDASGAKKERPTAADRSVAPIDWPEEREEEMKNSPSRPFGAYGTTLMSICTSVAESRVPLLTVSIWVLFDVPFGDVASSENVSR